MYEMIDGYIYTYCGIPFIHKKFDSFDNIRNV